MVEELLKTGVLKDGSALQTPSVRLRRLTRKEEVQRVFAEGRKFISPSFVIFLWKIRFRICSMLSMFVRSSDRRWSAIVSNESIVRPSGAKKFHSAVTN